MKSVGSVIAGDERYGGGGGEGRLMLHMAALRLDLASLGLGKEVVQVFARPKDFELDDDQWLSVEDHALGRGTFPAVNNLLGGAFDEDIRCVRAVV